MVRSDMELMIEQLTKTTELSMQNARTSEHITMALGVVAKNYEETNLLVRGLADNVSNMDIALKNVVDDVNVLKTRTRISSHQSDKIQAAAKKRIMEILGNDMVSIEKYFAGFISLLYSDAKKAGILGARLADTQTGDYARAFDFIESWMPKCGVAARKDYLDQKAAIRRSLKNNVA